MRFLILFLALLLAGCGGYADVNYAFPKDPFEINMAKNSTQNNSQFTANITYANITSRKFTTEIFPDQTSISYPQRYDRSGASMLVSNGERAARTFIHDKQVLQLNFHIPVEIFVVGIEEGKVMLEVNGVRHTFEENENQEFENNTIIVHVSEIIHS